MYKDTFIYDYINTYITMIIILLYIKYLIM